MKRPPWKFGRYTSIWLNCSSAGNSESIGSSKFARAKWRGDVARAQQLHQQQSVIFTVAILVLHNVGQTVRHPGTTAKFDRLIRQIILHVAYECDGAGLFVRGAGGDLIGQRLHRFIQRESIGNRRQIFSGQLLPFCVRRSDGDARQIQITWLLQGFLAIDLRLFDRPDESVFGARHFHAGRRLIMHAGFVGFQI